MFNAPRRMGGPTLAQSAFFNSAGGSNAYSDPLASSTPNPASYGDVDPWSAVPSPARSETPRVDSVEENVEGREPADPARDGLSGLIGALFRIPSSWSSRSSSPVSQLA
jgi:sorting nexin-8